MVQFYIAREGCNTPARTKKLIERLVTMHKGVGQTYHTSDMEFHYLDQLDRNVKKHCTYCSPQDLEDKMFMSCAYLRLVGMRNGDAYPDVPNVISIQLLESDMDVTEEELRARYPGVQEIFIDMRGRDDSEE